MPKSLAILLGADEWPSCPVFKPTPAFRNSADFFRDYLVRESGLNLSLKHILWLFNDKEQPVPLIEKIQHFLRSNADSSISDVIMFYVGHGAYLDGNYSLAMYCTNQTNRALSTLPVKYLAKVLYEYTPDKRHIVIIDACFAGGAVPAFIEQDLADPVGIVRDQVREILQETDISRGSALFCSAGPKAVAKAPSDGTYTMFSGALRKVLLTGDPTLSGIPIA